VAAPVAISEAVAAAISEAVATAVTVAVAAAISEAVAAAISEAVAIPISVAAADAVAATDAVAVEPCCSHDVFMFALIDQHENFAHRHCGSDAIRKALYRPSHTINARSRADDVVNRDYALCHLAHASGVIENTAVMSCRAGISAGALILLFGVGPVSQSSIKPLVV